MKRVAVIGHFGFGKNLLNGQTVKTKILADELERRYGAEEILRIDTSGGKKALFKAPFQTLRALRTCKNVIILPAHNGLRVFVPLLTSFRRLFRGRRLHYAVIGGWLPEFLQSRRALAKRLRSFDGIYVETHTMCRALEGMSFSNVAVMPNCKRLEPVRAEELITHAEPPYRLCTFSRVTKEKGIGDAVTAVRQINGELGYTAYTLDIYGPIDESQRPWFEKLQAELPPYISYRGEVPFDRSVETLRFYDALLFPTYYEGEGVAGTVIDAFASGVPVIASDWRYNPELIRPYHTGLLVKCRDVDALTDGLRYMHGQADRWSNMRLECLEEFKRYLPENAMKVLVERL